MDSGSSSNPAAASGSNDNPMSDSPPKYVPQFSATTEMILKRINSGASASGSLSSIGITGTPPGYEDMRRSVLMGMKTSLNMEMPATPISNRARRGSANKTTSGRASATPSGSGAGSASGGKGKGKGAARGGKGRAGAKRKRVKEDSYSSEEEESEGNMSKLGEDSDSDESEEVTELPKITQSGRQIHKPAQFIPTAYEPSTKRRAPSKRSQEQALCKRCGRGHSPQNNMIVVCDGSNLGWHQMCHDPVISEEAVKDEEADWYCADCSLKKGIKSKSPESAKGVSWQGKSADQVHILTPHLPNPQEHSDSG